MYSMPVMQVVQVMQIIIDMSRYVDETAVLGT